MEYLEVGSRNFSDNEIKKYSLEYGVKITQHGGRINLAGASRDIDLVKGKIKKSIFFENNKLEKNYESKPGSFSSKLNEINPEVDENNYIEARKELKKNRKKILYDNNIVLQF